MEASVTRFIIIVSVCFVTPWLISAKIVFTLMFLVGFFVKNCSKLISGSYWIAMDIRLYENTELRKAMSDVLHPGGLALTEMLLDQCGLERGSFILDVGCGPGQSMDLFHKHGHNAIGVDLSIDLLKSAQRFGFVARADGTNLPFTSGVFDVVFLECIFSLCDNKASLLRECWRVLKTGGGLILSDVCFFTNESVVFELNNICNCISGALPVGQIQDMLERASFSICYKNELPQALGDFAAQLVWHTGSREILPRLLLGTEDTVGKCNQKKKSQLSYAVFYSKKM